MNETSHDNDSDVLQEQPLQLLALYDQLKRHWSTYMQELARDQRRADPISRSSVASTMCRAPDDNAPTMILESGGSMSVSDTNSTHRDDDNEFTKLIRSTRSNEYTRQVRLPLVGDVCMLPVRIAAGVWNLVPDVRERPLHSSARALADLYARGDDALRERLKRHLYARRWQEAIASAIRDRDLAGKAHTQEPARVCQQAVYNYLSDQWALERAAASVAEASRKYLEAIGDACTRIDSQNTQ